MWLFSAIGLFGINGLLLFATIFRLEQVIEVYNNLYGMVFIIESFVLLPLLYFITAVEKIKSPDWKGFMILSLQGSLAFSIPFSILYWSRDKDEQQLIK